MLLLQFLHHYGRGNIKSQLLLQVYTNCGRATFRLSQHSNNRCPFQARPTWEELLGGGGDLGLLGDAVSMVGGAGAAGCAEAGDFLHALGERGNLQGPQHIHWVWGGEAGEQTVIAIVTLIQTLITNPDGLWWDRDVHTAYRNTDIGSSAQKSLSRSFKA